MRKRVLAVILAGMMAGILAAGCGSSAGSAAPEQKKEEAAPQETEEAVEDAEAPSDTETEVETEAVEMGAVSTQASAAEEAASTQAPAAENAISEEPVELQVFIAASLNTSMQEVAAKYNEEHPNVKITFNADSSGKLLTQIEEGYTCDVFFSAAQKQMNQLEEDRLVVEGTRADVVNNQVVVIKRKDTESAVTGLADIGKASSIALADGSVPVGRYTRTALMNLGILPEVEDASVYLSLIHI